MEWIQFIQEAPTWLEPLPVIIQGEVADIDDQSTWKHALILQCCLCAELSDNSFLRNPVQLKQWLLTIVREDVGKLGKSLKEVAVEIRHYASQWSILSYTDFKDRCGWHLFGIFFSPVKDVFQLFLGNPQAGTLKVLLQWVSFLTRITLNTGFVPDVGSYYATEQRLADLVPDPIWDELRSVIYPIANRFELKEFLPAFSSGATSDSPKELGLWGKLRYGWAVTDNHAYLLWLAGWDVSGCQREQSRDCRLTFVPKGIDSRRSICEEPTFSMFLQQAVLREVQRWFSHDPVISQYINLQDQENQRDMARRASLNLDHATIDLSEASDSVSWKLVEYVLRGTKLLECLRNTRTESVLMPDGAIYKLHKFAPMGSALCFPVECLIFLGIALLACKRMAVHPSVGVYGDDIIVPGSVEEEIVFLLGHFGFLVNDKKSFWYNERFKESCGGEYFDGIDITPLYIPRRFRFPESVSSPASLSTYIDLGNRYHLYGYRMCRRYLISTLILPRFPGVRFSFSPENGLISSHPTNFHLKERWNEDYQRLEVLQQCLTNVGDRIEDDEARYFLTLLQYTHVTRNQLLYPEDLITVKLQLVCEGLQWKWTPAEDSALFVI